MNITPVIPCAYNASTNFSGKIMPKSYESLSAGRIGQAITDSASCMSSKSERLCKFVGKEGSCSPKIQIGDNSNLLLQMTKEDFDTNRDLTEAMARVYGSDGVFQFSLVGTDKKAYVRVPAQEMTDDMKVIDLSMQAGVHPFLKDILNFLNSHPEAVAEIIA